MSGARPRRGDERIWRVTEVDGEHTHWRDLGRLVRCVDCANLAVGDDGSRWCSHWDKKVPVDGFCHLGEEREVSNGAK